MYRTRFFLPSARKIDSEKFRQHYAKILNKSARMSDKATQIATPVATLITSYVSKKYTLDNTMYGSLYTICVVVITFLLTDVKDVIMGLFSFNFNFSLYSIATLFAFIAIPVLIWFCKGKIYDVYNKYYLSKYKKGKASGKFTCNQIIKYIQHFIHFYTFNDNLVCSAGKIDVSYIVGQFYFQDKNYNVSGKIEFVRNNSIITDVLLSDCDATNLAEYINNITKHDIGLANDDWLGLTIINPEVITLVTKYFSINYIMILNAGDSRYINTKTGSTINNLGNDAIQEFNDTYFGVHGNIFYHDEKDKKNETDDDEDGVLTFSNCKSNKLTLKEYIDNICTYVKDYEKKTGIIQLKEVSERLDGDGNVCKHLYVFYDNKKMKLAHLEKLFIKTFFHPQAEALWKMIKTIHYNTKVIWNIGQPPRINLLLHGPPGTGKSSFAYRMAMLTQRHIINCKISNYTKQQLFDLFTKPKIEKDHIYNANEVIFVLDEFDQDINTLLLNQKNKEKQIEKVKHIVDNLLENDLIPNADLAVRSEKSLDERTQQNKNRAIIKTDNNEQTANKEKEVQKQCDDTIVLKENTTAPKDNIDKMDKMITETNSKYKKISCAYADIVTLEDLLTVFQGAVPIEGAIIIAMTNHYEELNAKCPKLFRAGRMTPLYFGYFDTVILNKIAKYYFKQTINFTSDTIKGAQPSKVMEILVESKLQKRGKFKYFCEQLKTIVPEVIIPEVVFDHKKTEEYIDFTSYGNDKIIKTTHVTSTTTVEKTKLTPSEIYIKYARYTYGQLEREYVIIANPVVKYNLAELMYVMPGSIETLIYLYNIFKCSNDISKYYYLGHCCYHHNVYKGMEIKNDYPNRSGIIEQLFLYGLKLSVENGKSISIVDYIFVKPGNNIEMTHNCSRLTGLYIAKLQDIYLTTPNKLDKLQNVNTWKELIQGDLKCPEL